MNKAEQIAFMDSLTVEQRAKIAQIIRSADIEGDYRYNDNGDSLWDENTQETLASLGLSSPKGKIYHVKRRE